ncbi:GDP-L-fucose synthase [Alteromonas ponticola]|uniref:GDP-L-fucose synthase n=1 Tax=Alteromonas ponticola TaxID=2720613 RepID=A0ABX1R141_9ALTE|nr:GDP-L-fucose synthase [Alteromonas ponticola]NMH60183.1 GDP-L-fucose synthase [Alteromonas ponticola]
MKTVYVAGHKGMVGSAIVRQLARRDDINLIVRTRKELDLTSQSDVMCFFSENKIDEVYLAAAKVGGIHANDTYPADFIYENLIIETNIIHSAHQHDVKKLLFLGSSCIYPKHAEQPLCEDSLLTGKLEETNEAYAIAKIAGIKLCESFNKQYGRDYRSIMPTNLYGPNDNFHPNNSHVIPALLRRFHEAVVNHQSQVIAWGSGKPMREFLHVEDMANASIFVMELEKARYDDVVEPMLSHINVGTGEDCSVKELVHTIAKVTGFDGEIIWDTSKPDGTPRKLMDVSRLSKLGWQYGIKLEDGLRSTYDWFLNNQQNFRK